MRILHTLFCTCSYGSVIILTSKQETATKELYFKARRKNIFPGVGDP